MTRVAFVPLVIALLACAAGAALSHGQTLHDRVLGSSVILIARLSPAGESEWPGGALCDLDIREVLVPLDGLTDRTGLRLDNSIPGASIVGARHETPTDVDVVVFANRIGDWLFLLDWCSNSIVALRDEFEELPGPQAERRQLTRAEFLEHLRRQIGRMRDFDYLVAAHRDARGSVHPFSSHDRPTLLGRLLALSGGA